MVATPTYRSPNPSFIPPPHVKMDITERRSEKAVPYEYIKQKIDNIEFSENHNYKRRLKQNLYAACLALMQSTHPQEIDIKDYGDGWRLFVHFINKDGDYGVRAVSVIETPEMIYEKFCKDLGLIN